MVRNRKSFNPLGKRECQFYAGLIVGLLGIVLSSPPAFADGGVTFTDIAADDGAGITYRRAESPLIDAVWDELKQKPLYTVEDAVFTPAKSRGAPGVAIFDFDRDGDLDVYVTNGPGAANSLYSNQLKESGQATFVDVAVTAGVDITDQDSTGVCFGDIDNDGDQDLLVLGNGESNRLFENLGNGTFADMTLQSQLGGGNLHPSSCSMGDVNGDGLLDIAIANSYDNWAHRLPLMLFEFAELMEHNQLFLNQGGNVFADVSQASGIQNVKRMSWSLALVDYDLDGDADLIVADDQGPKSSAAAGGKDVGLVRIYRNDGTGSFIDVTEAVGTDRFGAWMGLAFGDLNSDGNMDVFVTNVGDYLAAALTPVVEFTPVEGDWNSGWFLGQDDGTFTFPGVGTLKATPFGWGTSAIDYDNDGDTDIIFHGGLEIGFFVEASNPGSLLQNDGSANFTRDAVALAGSTNHSRRNVQGMAVGDLNDDGFVDIVSVSNMDWPAAFPLAPHLPLGGPFDDAALIWPTFTPVDPTDPFQGFTWNGIDPADGTLSVEINSGDNGNGWVKVTVLGTIGLTTSGRVNRDGIGAVVTFTAKPERENRPVMRPIISGASQASVDSLETTFGLGSDKKGTIEVLWPGGVRNRLYEVRASERILFPEIPCSFDDESLEKQEHKACVKQALGELVAAGILGERESSRFRNSAMKAFKDHRKANGDEDE